MVTPSQVTAHLVCCLVFGLLAGSQFLPGKNPLTGRQDAGYRAFFVFKQIYLFILSGCAAQRGLWPPRIMRFLDHTQRRATVGRTPLDE
jgi:hypothetical protein